MNTINSRYCTQYAMHIMTRNLVDFYHINMWTLRSILPGDDGSILYVLCVLCGGGNHSSDSIKCP